MSVFNGGLSAEKTETPPGGTKEVTSGSRKVTDKNGDTTDINKKDVTVKDKEGNVVERKVEVTVTSPDSAPVTKTFDNVKDANIYADKQAKAADGDDSGWSHSKTAIFDEKCEFKGTKKYGSSGMTNPNDEVSKSNFKKCESSWASAYGGCVMNLLMDDFKTDDKSTGQDKCEKVGQGGPDAGLNCGKKSYGKDGLDVNLFFGTGSSQGAGVTDPGAG